MAKKTFNEKLNSSGGQPKPEKTTNPRQIQRYGPGKKYADRGLRRLAMEGD